MALVGRGHTLAAVDLLRRVRLHDEPCRRARVLPELGFDEEVFAWFQAIPAWATAAWAVGVWVSLLGAVLLLARSRHAATAFLVSLVGAAASFAYQFTSDRPASLEGFGNTVMPVVILIVIALQWYYARRMAAAGVLR